LLLCMVSGVVEEDSGLSTVSYGVANTVIAIDPGHGGMDVGANRGDILEKEITLEISKKLENYLSQAGAMVIMLRKDNNDLVGEDFSGTIRERWRKNLAIRVQKANEAKADLYISIHTNAVNSAQWSGAQTFYKENSQNSKITAETVQEELKNILKNTNRGVAVGSYYVLENTKMPAILVEVGFISNPQEASLLCDSTYQNKVAYAIFSGIVKAQEKILMGETQSLNP